MRRRKKKKVCYFCDEKLTVANTKRIGHKRCRNYNYRVCSWCAGMWEHDCKPGECSSIKYNKAHFIKENSIWDVIPRH